MGRPSKYRNHPLFRLRESLGKDEPMKQSELACLLDVPLLSIQAVEAGRRSRQGIAGELLEKIRRQTGSLWDPTTCKWLFDQRLLFHEVQPGQQYVPLTPELFTKYRAIVNTPLSQAEKDIDLVLYQAWLAELFQRIPDKSWPVLQSRVSVFVEQCCRDFRLGDPVEFFSKVSADTQDIPDAIIDDWAKGKSQRQLLSEALSLLRRVVPVFGADSEAGQDIINEYPKLARILEALPEETSTATKAGRKHQTKARVG